MVHISGADFKVAVRLAGGPTAAAQLLGLSRDTVHRYQHEGVHENSEPIVRHVLGKYLPDGDVIANPLARASNMELLAEMTQVLAEVARRLAVLEVEASGNGLEQSGSVRSGSEEPVTVQPPAGDQMGVIRGRRPPRGKAPPLT